jgi:hypothetical protein
MSTLRANKKQGKRKVLVTNRLIDTSMKILRAITNKGLIVEKVIEQTGLSDRSYFFDTKKVLIKNKLIKQTKLDERTEMIELDGIGRDVAMLMDYIERAQKCYQELIRAMHEKFNTNEYRLISTEMSLGTVEKANKMQKALNWRLRNLGWDSGDLSSYNVWVFDAISFEHKTASAYITALCSNYVLFLSKIGYNEIARSILHKVISTAFDKHFSRSRGIFNENILTNDSEKKGQLENNAAFMIISLNHLIYEYIKEYSHLDESKIYLPPYDPIPKNTNKFLKEKSREMIRSIFHLYALGSEQTNKEASELIEKYNQKRDNSADPLQSV